VPEADIAVKAEAVTNYVLRVKDLKVDRVVEYNAADLADYGLDAPQFELIVEINDIAMPALLISEERADNSGWYARSADAPHVLLLPADTVDRIRIDLAEFEVKP
jgi:hypothetical protein